MGLVCEITLQATRLNLITNNKKVFYFFPKFNKKLKFIYNSIRQPRRSYSWDLPASSFATSSTKSRIKSSASTGVAGRPTESSPSSTTHEPISTTKSWSGWELYYLVLDFLLQWLGILIPFYFYYLAVCSFVIKIKCYLYWIFLIYKLCKKTKK